jgi:hypothetical protein
VIASFRVGLRPGISVPEHRLELVNRRVKAMEANARSVARKMARYIERELTSGADRQVLTDSRWLETIAAMYGVVKPLIPYAVDCTRQLIRARGV